MTVWTPVSLKDVNLWLKDRALPAALSIDPIQEGVEDSLFHLTLDDNREVCLRLFERTEPHGALSIATVLAQGGLPTCPPLPDANNNVLVPLLDKPACLFPWIEGAFATTPTTDQIAQVGAFLGHVAHRGGEKDFNWQRENPRGWQWFDVVTEQLRTSLAPEVFRDVEEERTAQHHYWTQGAGAGVPRGPTHGDMFRDNVLFGADDALVAVIDWGFCASAEPSLYDLAVVANDWCLQQDNINLDANKVKALLSAREAVMPLTPQEKDAWPMALRFAALRFYLSRLYDYYFPRGSSGKTLDPDVFATILHARKEQQS